MYKHPNLSVHASKSGLINKPLLQEWFKDVFFPFCEENCVHRDLDQIDKRCLLLTDSFSTYKDQEYFTAVKPIDLEYHTEMIPPGTTGMILEFLDRIKASTQNFAMNHV